MGKEIGLMIKDVLGFIVEAAFFIAGICAIAQGKATEGCAFLVVSILHEISRKIDKSK